MGLLRKRGALTLSEGFRGISEHLPTTPFLTPERSSSANIDIRPTGFDMTSLWCLAVESSIMVEDGVERNIYHVFVLRLLKRVLAPIAPQSRG